MRLNRGTIALIVVALLVIIGVTLFNNNQAAAPGANTPTPETTSGPLWQGLDQNTVTRLEVRDNHSGQAIVLGKAQNGGWDVVDSGIAESASTGGVSSVTYTKPQALPIDTAKVSSSVTAFAGFQYADKFDSASLADFGLDQPLYTIYASTSSGAIFAIHVGSKNPNNTRYYAAVEQIAGASTTPEATATAEVTDAAMAAISAAISAQDAQVSAIRAAVDAATGTTPEAASEAATTEATQALSAVSAATAESTGTAEATAATAEATFSMAEATAAESTPEGTPVVLAEPLVSLTGNQTIYLLPQDVVAGMIGYLSLPPYIYPTATPTLPPTANPYSEVQQTATAVIQQTAMQSTMESIISTATARAVTPEATAAATEATAEATP